MKSPRSLSHAILIAAIGCAESPLEQARDGHPPTLARGGVNAVPRVPVRLEWDDGFAPLINGVPTPAGIVGDGRDVKGDPGASAFQHDVCEVNAMVEESLHFDLYTATTCGAPRVLQFYFAGRDGAPSAVQSLIATRFIAEMVVGETTSEPFQMFNSGPRPNCTSIRYGDEYAGSNGALRTRLPDDPSTGARRWRIESTGTHRAQCIYRSVSGKVLLGPLTVPMPFAYTIIEVK